jgi:excisionase family DNA binding protein
MTAGACPATWLSVTEAANLLGIGPRLMRRVARENSLPVRRVAGADRLPRDAIEAWLDGRLGCVGWKDRHKRSHP